MYDAGIAGMFLLAFIIGLTGALAPGPMLVATITASIRDGWTVGPRIVAGHMAIEAIFVLFILVGLADYIIPHSTIIAFAGGISLVFFGAITLRAAQTASLLVSGEEEYVSPYLAGFITSVSNPYFWLWWLTIGAGFLLDGVQGGFLVVGAFVAGHWLADLGWFTFISVGIGRSRTLLSEQVYRGVIRACGVILVLFGLYYIVSFLPVLA